MKNGSKEPGKHFVAHWVKLTGGGRKEGFLLAGPGREQQRKPGSDDYQVEVQPGQGGDEQDPTSPGARRKILPGKNRSCCIVSSPAYTLPHRCQDWTPAALRAVCGD